MAINGHHLHLTFCMFSVSHCMLGIAHIRCQRFKSNNLIVLRALYDASGGKYSTELHALCYVSVWNSWSVYCRLWMSLKDS
jgi:hypothetical protein